MTFQISTRTLQEAFVGVPYEDFIVAEGMTQAGTGYTSTITWAIGPTPGYPPYSEYVVNNPGTSITAYSQLTGLTRGLVWTSDSNQVDITGTPEDDFDDSSGVIYPVKTVELNVIAIHRITDDATSEVIITQQASRVIRYDVNRVVDDYTAETFLERFKEADNLIKEDILAQIIVGIPEDSDNPSKKSATVNSLLKKITDLYYMYEGGNTYTTYYKIIGDESYGKSDDVTDAALSM